VTVPHLRLPTAWRGTGSTVRTVRVGFADLAPLDTDQLVAAHIEVLGTLTEERMFRTDVHRDGAAHTEDTGDLADRALITTGTPTAPAERYGLHVEVRDGALLLHSRAITDGYLHRLASMYRGALEAKAEGRPGWDAYLPSEDRDRVLGDWATGPSVRPAAGTFADHFGAQAARTPDAPAVQVSGTTLTYAGLDTSANRIARWLRSLGVGAETPVGVSLRRAPDLLPVILGVWRAGGVYVPLDPGLPRPRLSYMTDAAGCALVVTDELLRSEEDTVAALPATPPGVAVRPEQLAYVIYTSGSTGNPKGVLVQHDSLLNYLLWTVEEYAARGTGGSALFTSTGFDLGMPSLLTPLLTGQRVDLLPDPLDTADLGERLVRGGPYSFLKMTPGHLNMLSLELTEEEARDLAGVVIAAGDAFPAALARRWRDLAGPGGTLVATEYGPTEITVGNSGQLITDPAAHGLLPLGAPIRNTTMYVLTERLAPVPVGVPGEVHVGGAGVARGYLGDPALTAERFVPDPYGPPGARLYRTGDRARWLPDGSLEFLGRVDHQVKIRGHRVEPAEIQAVLLRRSEVGEVAVIACEQPPRPVRLVAFVLPADGMTVDPAGLRTGLAADLPDHMVPAEIVPVDEIPLTANGKVDTRALRALL
jgi:amino acid adenylation domain-containing protein